MLRLRTAAFGVAVCLLGIVAVSARGPRDSEILEQLKARVDAKKNVGMVGVRLLRELRSPLVA